MGDGDELREFLFIDDLTEIVWQLLFQRDNNVVNVVSGQSHDFMTIVNSINLLADYSVHVNSRARSKPKVDQAYKNELLKTLIPEGKFTRITEGIRRIWDDESRNC